MGAFHSGGRFSLAKCCFFVPSTELSDGLVLIRLLEGLTKKRISGCESHPKITAHKMVNLDLVFQFIANERIKLIGIGAPSHTHTRTRVRTHTQAS